MAVSAVAQEPLRESGESYLPDSDMAWATLSPEQAGWDATALDNALRFAGEHASSAVVVLYQGRILAEKYWQVSARAPIIEDLEYSSFLIATDPVSGPLEDVASVQKSVVALLVLIAAEKQLLRLDDAVSEYLGAGWSASPLDHEGGITLRHLLSMTSGLTEDLTADAPPGERWFYNTGAYSRLIEVLKKASGRELEQITADWLTLPLGMASTRWVRRPWVPEGVNPYGLAINARDLARIGLLIMNAGQWHGKQVVNPRLLARALEASQTMNPAYGWLWWLNDGDVWQDFAGGVHEGRLFGPAPQDMVSAHGIGDHKLFVVPSLEIVVVRLGAMSGFRSNFSTTSSDPWDFDRELWRRLMLAVPLGRT